MKNKCFIISILAILSLGIVLISNNKKYKVNNDSLAVFVDGERTDTFPNKDNYVFVNSNCDNDVSIEWDNDTWSLYASNLDKKVKCNLYFQEKLVSKVTNLSKIDTADIATDDPDNNIRYIGANPNNYVYFNCSDYSNQSDSTCEKWRIIGIFNNITKSDGTKENLVKIVRDDSIGNYSWDYTSTGSYTNDWSTSTLQQMLNSGAYSNATTGTYYNGSTTATNVDFTAMGLKNDIMKNAIESVVWNLGGYIYNPVERDTSVSTLYTDERGNNVYNGRTTTWTGKIGLMYSSDYGYATSGNSSTNRAACLSEDLYVGYNDDCKNNDYLYDSDNQWTLTNDGSSDGVLYLSTDGFVFNNPANGSDYGVRPALFLKSNISVDSGTGESSNPYRLKL